MRLNDLKPHPDSISDRKRVGRGIGSGDGKTAEDPAHHPPPALPDGLGEDAMQHRLRPGA